MQCSLSILMAGRIYEQQQVFELIQHTVALFSHALPTNFYFMDKRTLDKAQSRMVKTLQHVTYNLFISGQNNDIIDYIISIGGDGTILYAAKEFPNKAPPIISFQRGTLGFMCRFEQQQIKDVVYELSNYQCQKNKQQNLKFPFESTQIMRIEAVQTRKNKQGKFTQPIKKTCVNEICISRKECERVIVEIYINDEKITETAGDGILVSTPTGSTAYSLSAGGPIMQNGVNSILITPIAPNSLSFRPICLPSDSKIKLKLSTKSRSVGYVSYDGQSNFQFNREDQIQVTMSNNGIKFLEPTQKMAKMPTWMQRLKFFLGWNQVFRYPQCKLRK